MNIINFSGGRTSAYLTKRLIDEGGDYLVTFQNTGKESPETLDFVNECDKRWNLNIVWLEYRSKNDFAIVDYETASRKGEPFEQAINDEGMIPNQFVRFCTRKLKKETGERYLKSIGVQDPMFYLGIRHDEPRRWSKRIEKEDNCLPLVKWRVSKKDVLNWWEKQDFNLLLDEPFGNCDLCFHKKKHKIRSIAISNPELFKWWEDQEKKIGHHFRSEGSMAFVKKWLLSQTNLFEQEDDAECFCTID